MSVEDILLSQGGRIFKTKITGFMRTLIIKNESEAEGFETEESKSNYLRYLAAADEYDSIMDYIDNLNVGYLRNEGYIPNYIIERLEVSMRYIEEYKNDSSIQTLLKNLRRNVVNNYVDMNPYYRMLSGTPKDITE